MTIEQLQEENMKLKQAIITMYRRKFQSKEERAFYHSSLNYAYHLTKSKDYLTHRDGLGNKIKKHRQKAKYKNKMAA